jgi:hypothetical protein
VQQGGAAATSSQRAVGGVREGGCLDVGGGEEGDGVAPRKEVPWWGRRSRVGGDAAEGGVVRKEMRSRPPPIA